MKLVFIEHVGRKVDVMCISGGKVDVCIDGAR